MSGTEVAERTPSMSACRARCIFVLAFCLFTCFSFPFFFCTCLSCLPPAPFFCNTRSSHIFKHHVFSLFRRCHLPTTVVLSLSSRVSCDQEPRAILCSPCCFLIQPLVFSLVLLPSNTLRRYPIYIYICIHMKLFSVFVVVFALVFRPRS